MKLCTSARAFWELLRKYVRGPGGGGHPAWFRKVTLIDKGRKPYEAEQVAASLTRHRLVAWARPVTPWAGGGAE